MRIHRFLKDHPIATEAEAIQSICRPLQALGIVYFSHARVNEKKELAFLSSHPDFVNLYLQKGYYQHDLHMLNPQNNESYVLWDLVERKSKSKKLHSDFTSFNQDHTFSIIQKNNKGYDIYHFATRPSELSANQMYLENLQNLKLFIRYFQDKISCQKSLKDSYTNKTIQLVPSKGTYNTEKPILNNDQSFLQQIDYYSKCSALTKREDECLHLWLKGYKAKEIADFMELSYRTVQKHLENIKSKIGAGNRCELLELLSW